MRGKTLTAGFATVAAAASLVTVAVLMCLAFLGFTSRAEAFVVPGTERLTVQSDAPTSMALGWTRTSSLWTVRTHGLPGSRLTPATSTGANFNARGTIGRANLDGTGANQSFIAGAGHYPNLVAVDDTHCRPAANAEMDRRRHCS